MKNFSKENMSERRILLFILNIIINSFILTYLSYKDKYYL